MTKNIIFDLDGTLLDTLGDLANSTNHALITCGYPQVTTQQIRSYVGNGVAMLIQRAMPEGHSPQEFSECLKAFKNHYNKHCLDCTKPYPHIMQTLCKLKERGIAMAIVSNKLQQAVEELSKHYFNGIINVAIGETDQVRRKPAPDMVIKAIEKLGGTPQDTIYIGDSEVDIQTAQNANLKCLSVTWGFKNEDFLRANGATTIIHTPEEILNHI